MIESLCTLAQDNVKRCVSEAGLLWKQADIDFFRPQTMVL